MPQGMDSSAGQALTEVLWPDAEIESLAVDYDAVRIVLAESTGARREVQCFGYIGFRVVGFWDEVVVADAALFESAPFIDECLHSLEVRHTLVLPRTDSSDRNAGRWTLLQVTLSDGVNIQIVASRFIASAFNGGRGQ